ncbi:MAG: hypothetical protein DCF22_24745 [Leptolyngbya sp.]|nr:MAG: hypothetical protein DCF22_24745 [Leptolyngbya sp.]
MSEANLYETVKPIAPANTTYPIVPLGKVLRLVERFEPRNELEVYQFAGTYSFARGIFVGELKPGSSFRLEKIQRVYKGDFVYCKIMAWEGAFGIVPEEAHHCVMSGAFVVYEIDQNQVEPLYLDYYFKLKSVWESIGSSSTGTNIRRRSLHPKQFEAATMPLPPISEQRRIVARVEDLAGKVEEARGLRSAALEEAEFIRLSALSHFFDFEFPAQLPKDWCWKPFNDLLINDREGIMTGPFGTLLNKSDIYDEGVPVLGISNVQANQFVPGFSDYTTTWKAESLSSYRLQAEDIVIARSGTVGRSCLVPVGLHPLTVMSSNLIRLRLDKNVFIPELLSRIFNGSQLVERHKAAECRGSSRTFFTQKILSKLMIPAPPIPEQRRIVAYLDDLQAKVDALKRLQSETAAELNALLPSILDKAFKGEL